MNDMNGGVRGQRQRVSSKLDTWGGGGGVNESTDPKFNFRIKILPKNLF